MKYRVFILAALMATSAFAPAQEQTATQGAVSWLQQQWKRVEDSGRPMAEKIVREFPQRFKDMKAQVANVSKLTASFSEAHQLPQKQALLVELWRVRGSLNLLSLLSPDILHQLTGLDAKTLQSMTAEVTALRERVSKLSGS